MSIHALKILPRPLRGEVWQAEGETGPQPVVIVSDDRLNHSRAGLVLVVPVSFTGDTIPSHIRIKPPEGGLQQPAFIHCELLHSVKQDHLTRQLGALHPATLSQVEECLKLLLSF